jgi:hypothetical protein
VLFEVLVVNILTAAIKMANEEFLRKYLDIYIENEVV